MKTSLLNVLVSYCFIVDNRCIACLCTEKSKEKIYRLPDDLETLAGDPALLKKPEGLTVAAYAFLIIMLRLCIIKYILRAGLNII